VYAIKKPSPWQGESATRRRTPYGRATPPDRSGRTRNGTMAHEIPSPRNRSISARLGSAHVKPNGGTPRPMLSTPDRSPCRRREGSARARRDPPARQRPLPQNSATRASLFVITAPGHSADRAEHYSWRGVAAPRGSTQ